MILLLLQVASSSATIISEKLTHESISDFYIGLNAHGMLYDNTTQHNDVVMVESTKDNCVTLCAYAENKVQKWFIETQTPIALTRILVQKFGVRCATGVNDNLFG
jgi:hypothetical protein